MPVLFQTFPNTGFIVVGHDERVQQLMAAFLTGSLNAMGDGGPKRLKMAMSRTMLRNGYRFPKMSVCEHIIVCDSLGVGGGLYCRINRYPGLALTRSVD